LVPTPDPAHSPGDEAVGVHRPDRRLAEGDVVVVDEPLELARRRRPFDAAVDPLRQAGRLDDPKALHYRRLGGDQLQQQALGLLDVVHPRGPPKLDHVVQVHFCVREGVALIGQGFGEQQCLGCR